MITQTFWKCVQAVKDDFNWATHLQSPSCLPCFVSSCCSSLCTAATAASPSWSTRRAARSTRQSGPAPQLPRCPPREPEQPSAQNTAATNSSCLRLTNYGSRGLNSCQIYWDDCRQFTFPLPLLPTIALPCDLWPRALPPKTSFQFCLKEGIINGWIFLLLSFDTPALWPNISNCLLLHDSTCVMN